MVGLLTEIIGSPTPSDIPLVPSTFDPEAVLILSRYLPQKWYFRNSIDYSVSLNYAVLDYASRNHDELLYNMYKMGKNSIERGSKDYWSLSPKRIAEIEQLQPCRSTAKQHTNAAGTCKWRWRGGGVPMKFYDSVLKNPENRDARGYILSADQPDFPTAVKFLNALIRTGVLVHKATAAFTVAGKSISCRFLCCKNQPGFPSACDGSF
jgi:hypothetical protein